MSVNNTNPQTLFGGTWTQIKDKFILAAGDVYRNGDTGGSDTHNHSLNDGYAKITRTFAGDSLYSNEKTVSEYWLSSNGRTYPVNSESYAGNCNKGVTLGGTTENVSNMPPYLVAYVWKRTA